MEARTPRIAPKMMKSDSVRPKEQEEAGRKKGATTDWQVTGRLLISCRILWLKI